MKILVACEESQAVTIELRKLGHEARIKKIMRRRAWVNGHRTGKARKNTWKRA